MHMHHSFHPRQLYIFKRREHSLDLEMARTELQHRGEQAREQAQMEGVGVGRGESCVFVAWVGLGWVGLCFFSPLFVCLVVCFSVGGVSG